MADEWYCEIAGREIGPLTAQQLRVMAAKGQILPNDCVRQGVQGAWTLARQVRGLLAPAADVPSVTSETPAPPPTAPPLQRRGVSLEQEFPGSRRPNPPAFQAQKPDSLPVAQRLPDPPAAPVPPPSPPPVAPPQVADVFDVVALGIVTDEPIARPGGQARTKVVLTRERQRLERQKITVGVLAASVVGLAIAGLVLAIGGGGSSGSGQSASPESPPSESAPAPVKKTPAAKANAESPEALEAREGIETLDSPKPERRKIGAEAPKTPVAADSDDAKTAGPKPSRQAVPQTPHEPRPGTSKADPSSR